jgi:hypothetical protein
MSGCPLERNQAATFIENVLNSIDDAKEIEFSTKFEFLEAAADKYVYLRDPGPGYPGVCD